MCTVELVEQPAELEARRDAWEALARCAVEPNIFLEPGYVMPALRHLASPRDRLAVLFVWRIGAGTRELVGLTPIWRAPRSAKVPVSSFGTWGHKHAFLGTPLLAPEDPEDTLRAVLGWARGPGRRGGFLRFERVGAEGPFCRALEAALDGSCGVLVMEASARPVFRKRNSWSFEDYYGAGASGTRRRRYRGLGQQLAGRGEVEFTEITDEAGCDLIATQYLELEAAGWKGRAGTALAARPAECAFCREVVGGFAARRRFRALALRLDGRPIAIRMSLQSGSANFCFKTSYDPAYAHYSPGVLLEIEQVRRMASDASLDWADSCATSATTPLSWLWTDRREIRSLLVPLGDGLGALCAATMPLLWRVGAGLKRTLSGRSRAPAGGSAAPSNVREPKDHR